MKKLISFLVLISASATMAASTAFYYTEGNSIGEKVEHTGYLARTASCYKGNPWAARKILIDMADDNIEQDNVRAWYSKKDKVIEFRYVDTKCMDDSLDATEEGCTTEVIIPKC